MASCSDNVCGTGSGNWPQPGDPNLSDQIITAQAGSSGISVYWTYPSINPHAVAHTNLYRAKVNNFDHAARIAVATGNQYLDQNEGLEVGQTYYYWIRMISVNGTEGDVIGPASATAISSWEQIREILEGELSEDLLESGLKDKINRILDVSTALDQETQERLLGESVFTQMLSQFQDQLGDVGTLIAQETYERITKDSALVARIDGLFAKANQNGAAILQEQAVRADATSALALQINTLQAGVGADIASIQQWQQVTVNPSLNTLRAKYTVSLDVSGYVTGFTSLNDGNSSSFIVRADKFAVADPQWTGQGSEFPFKLGKVNGVTRIVLDAATWIPDATITNGMIENYIASPDYNISVPVASRKGWAIFKDLDGLGSYAEFNNIRARGDIEATSIRAGTIESGHIKTGSIEAKHIRGGGVSQVRSGSASGKTVGPQSETFGFNLHPNIPQGVTGNVICMVDFQGEARNFDTNIGVRVYRRRATGQRMVIHVSQFSVDENRTGGGSTSFSDTNVAQGTYYEVYLLNQWNRGTINGGKANGHMMVTLM